VGFVRSCLAAAIVIVAFAVLPASASASQASAVSTMVNSVNAVRAHHGLRPLRPSPALLRSSERYSQTLMRRDRFGHSGLARLGRFNRLGEALEMHSGNARRPRMALKLLMRSPPHRHLILSHSQRLIGAGVARGRFRGSRATIWVLHFGRR
jgi:uncharacterized protein YkwD